MTFIKNFAVSLLICLACLACFAVGVAALLALVYWFLAPWHLFTNGFIILAWYIVPIALFGALFGDREKPEAVLPGANSVNGLNSK
jgi:hypothetical protein